MSQIRLGWLPLCLFTWSLGFGSCPVRADDASEAKIDYAKEIQPILRQKCLRCHNDKKQDGKLDLTTRAAMLKGGTSGPALVPGNVEKSLMLELIEFGEMPPKNQKPRVSKEELEKLNAWVAAGAPVPK